MIEILALYFTVIGTIGTLIGIYIQIRKTRKKRIEELKVEMLVILSQNGSYTIIDGTEDDVFQLLDSKYQVPKYAMLHRLAFDELKRENQVTVRPDPRLPGPDSY